MDLLFFIARYTPFWAVPCLLICVHFAYLYWLQDYRRVVLILVLLSAFFFCANIFYIFMGGPQGIVDFLGKFQPH